MRLACAFAVVLFGVGFALFWFVGRAPIPASPRGARDAESTPRSNPALVVFDEPSVSREQAPEGAKKPAPIARPRESRGVLIALVEHDSARPVVGADVWIRSVLRDEDERRYESGEIEFEEVAEHLRSDERGFVRVDAVLATELRIVARKGTVERSVTVLTARTRTVTRSREPARTATESCASTWTRRLVSAA